VIAVDTNILVYAHRSDARLHATAAKVMVQLAEDAEAWAIPWQCLVEFVAVVTNPRIWRVGATPMDAALLQIESWLESPTINTLAETPQFFATFRDLLLSSGVSGGQVHDARIAAICMYHGVSELWTADRDFGRFPRLKTRNPLVK
jgi:toxin-antitoxin system PIN domain toxin